MPSWQHTATPVTPLKKWMATPMSCGLSAGITPKAKLWVARIMKASSAQCAHVMNADENERKLDSMMDSLTSSDPNPDLTPAPMPYTAPVNGLVTKKPERKKFHLDSSARLSELWKERLIRRERYLEDGKWLDMFDELLAEAMGDSEEVYVGNKHVATYANNGSFRKKAFLAEQPELAEACMKYELVFSLDHLKQTAPQVYAQYRARAMNIKNNPESI